MTIEKFLAIQNIFMKKTSIIVPIVLVTMIMII